MIKPSIATTVIALSAIHSFAQVTVPDPYPGSAPVNYIRTWEAVKPTTNPNDLTMATGVQEARMSTQYYDGLGRLIQVVNKQGSLETGGTAKDLVSTVIYDEFGREIYKYLPFAANSTGGNTSIADGLFKINPFQQQESFATAQYPSESYYYGKVNYEASPINRIQSMYSAGDSWVGSEADPNLSSRRGIKIKYQINSERDSVRIWKVDSNGVSSSPSFYQAGQLYKTITADEHQKEIIEFKDKSGLVVLRKVQLWELPAQGHSGWLCTYYVYDDLDLLRLAIPPKATKELVENSWAITQTILDELCFRYEFDQRNRPIVQKVPGAAEVRFVYDARDRQVLSQDGKQRSDHKWLFTKYDGLNRY